eukprot:2562224-Lingulodinium_polyedra.AAC.1
MSPCPRATTPPALNPWRSAGAAGRPRSRSARRWTLTGRPAWPRTSPPPGSRAAVASVSSSTVGCASRTSTPR